MPMLSPLAKDLLTYIGGLIVLPGVGYVVYSRYVEPKEVVAERLKKRIAMQYDEGEILRRKQALVDMINEARGAKK